MATASAFGISGYDPFGSFLEGMMNSYFGNKNDKKSLNRQIQSQKQMTEWSAKNLPLFQRLGLEAAGYNPMLALGNLGGYSSGSFHSGYNDTNSSSFGGFDASSFASGKEAFRREKIITDIEKNTKAKLEAEIQSIKTKTKNDSLETISKLKSEEKDRDLMDSQIKRNKVESVTSPINPIRNIGDLTLDIVNSNHKPNQINGFNSVLSNSAKGLKDSFKEDWLTGLTLSLGLPLIYGSAVKAGEEARKKVKQDKNSDYKKRQKGWVPNSFGIPSYWQY